MMVASNSNNKRKKTVPKSKPAKTCDKCSFSTNEMVEFIEHMKLDHNLDEIYPCDLCTFYTESLWDYQGHMGQHLEQKSTMGQNMNSSTASSITESITESTTETKDETPLEKTELDEEDEQLEIAESPVNKQELFKQSDKDDESENEEEDCVESDEENIDDPKSSSSPKSYEANLLTTVADSDMKKINQQQQENDYHQDEDDQQQETSECTFPNKMIYEPANHVMTGGAAFNYMLNNGQQNSRLYGMKSTDQIQPQQQLQHDMGIEKVKRHYNSEVDPARYRKVMEEGVTKFACSLCGNTYKWRKSLNKHWKEKHITEIPPPLDAPVTVKLRNGNTTINCIAPGGQNPGNKSLPSQQAEKSYRKPQQQQQQQQPKAAESASSQLPFSPALLAAAASAANAATVPSGQLHPAYWTVFYQYLNTATSSQHKAESAQSSFSIPQLSRSSLIKTDQTEPEAPLDLSIKNHQTTISRRSSINSSYSEHSSEMHEECQETATPQANQQAKHRHSRRSDFNMKTLLRPQSRSSSSRAGSSASNTSNPADCQANADLYKSYNEEDSLNITNNSKPASQQSSSSAAAAAAAAAATAYNQKLFVCSICDAKFHVVDHINDHFLKNHYTEYQRELSSKSPPRNTNVALQNEQWNLSDPNNPLKCIKCDFVGRWPTELQKHAASHSTSRPFKCLICSLTYKWRWDLAKHFDRTHPNFRNPYKKRDRDAARSNLVPRRVSTGSNHANNGNNQSSLSIDQDNENYNYDDELRSRSPSNSSLNSENNEPHHSPQSSPSIKKEPTPNSIQYPTQKTPKQMQQQAQRQQQQQQAPTKSFKQEPIKQQQPQINELNNNPMLAYLAALQNNMFQQQQPTISPPSQISPFSLLQQQQQQKSSFMTQQFNQQQQPDAQNPTAAILAAAMAAMAQGNMDPSNITQLLPHLLQNMQQQQNISSSSSTTSSKQEPHFNSNLLSPSSSSSSHSHQQLARSQQQPAAKKQRLTDSLLLKADQEEQSSIEKESRNFLCYWCDFRGRWRSEIIQHMRCHHAREKPYRCSACMYASNWKWDVQKHTKKQHPNNLSAKIVEISDKILFPDLKDLNFFENVKPTVPSSTQNDQKQQRIPRALNLTPPSDSSSSSSLSSSPRPLKQQQNSQQQQQQQHKRSTAKHHSLCCQQCPYVACNLSDLRRHLIVHSNEQPYHCCSCDFKSKWKSDVKKHQRSVSHAGPILVGKKAMQKVIESLGLDKNSMVTLYGPNIEIIDNKQCKSNEKLIDEDNLAMCKETVAFQRNKSSKFVTKQSESTGIKRKQPESDTEEFEEMQTFEDDEDDYEQLNENEEDIDDEYEQVLAYNNNNNNNGCDDYMDMDENEGLMDDDQPIDEYPNQPSVNSQFSDENHNEQHGLNELELDAEIDC